MTSKVTRADDHFHDECGVFGVFGHPEAANLAYLGLYALQHRGQESAGIVSSDGKESYVHRAMGKVEEIFQPSVLAQLPGSLAIGHTRYSTAGDKALLNAQPIMIDCNKGKVALGHNGNLTSAAASSIAARFSRPTATPKSSSISSLVRRPAIFPARSATRSIKSKAHTPFSCSLRMNSTPSATPAASDRSCLEN